MTAETSHSATRVWVHLLDDFLINGMYTTPTFGVEELPWPPNNPGVKGHARRRSRRAHPAARCDRVAWCVIGLTGGLPAVQPGNTPLSQCVTSR